MVPLAFIGKDTLRNFDISGQDGQSLPVLGRSENGEVALAALMSALRLPSEKWTQETADLLRQIVYGDPMDAVALAQELLETGAIKGVSVTSAPEVSDMGRLLARSLADNFLLIALVPVDAAGSRQLIKYSFHWRTRFDWSGKSPLLDRLLVAGGFSAIPLEVELSGPSDASSYHLEVHAPPGLVCAGLGLPSTAPDQRLDDGLDVIAHAVGSFVSSDVVQSGRLQLAVPKVGLRLLTALVCFYTSVVMGLALLLPDAKTALLEASDGAAAILLAVPAFVVALLARPEENAIASELLLPLRVTIIGCSAALIAVGASVVGVLHEPYIQVLWIGCFAGAVIAFIYLTIGLIVGES